MQKFKTNLQCRNCVRAVSGFLWELPKISSWEVDTDHPDKILTVRGEGVLPDSVLLALEQAGFEGEFLREENEQAQGVSG